MIRILLMLLVLAAIVASLLHISIWIALGVIVGGLAIYALSGDRNRTGGGFVKPSAAWKCPYCLKRVKIGATACHHCGRSLLKDTYE